MCTRKGDAPSLCYSKHKLNGGENEGVPASLLLCTTQIDRRQKHVWFQTINEQPKLPASAVAARYRLKLMIGLETLICAMKASRAVSGWKNCKGTTGVNDLYRWNRGFRYYIEEYNLSKERIISDLNEKYRLYVRRHYSFVFRKKTITSNVDYDSLKVSYIHTTRRLQTLTK